ncbi:MAG: hypothetical protein M3Q75_00940, partial [Gemmatimonadota bacterium]|nr:hypothetical protein [Gemmatimonadota bacterium]
FDASRAPRLAAARFTVQQSGDLVEVARPLKKAGVDGGELTEAIRQGADSRLFKQLDVETGGLVTRAASWTADVRSQANEIAGFDYIAERENFVHRMLTPEAREHFAKVASGKARARPFAKGDFERRALKAGDEWMGVELTDDVPVETQVQQIANDVFGSDVKQLFEDDWYTVAQHYLRSVGKSVRDKAEMRGLKERGVITETPTGDLDGLAEAVRSMKVAEPDAHRQRAAMLRSMEAGTHDPNQAAVARALAERSELDAEMATQEAAKVGRAQAAVDVVQRELEGGGLRKPETQAAIRELIEQELAQQFRLFQLGPGMSTTQKLGGPIGEQIPTDVLGEMVKARELVSTDYGKFLRSIDAMNRGFKTYALLTPGFHVRNSFGGTFNNAVADMDPSNYLVFARMRHAHERVLDGKLNPAKIRNQFAYGKYVELFDSGLLDDGARVVDATDATSPRSIGEAVLRGAPGRPGIRNLKSHPLTSAKEFAKSRPLTDTRFTRLNRLAGQRTEDYLRGSLALDRLLKGSTIDGAIDDVHHFHFDYHDLSKLETGVLKRVIPFYTWTSRNLGRQLEFFLTNPKAYSRWNALKAATGEPETGESATPDYLQGPGTIRWAGGDALTLPDAVPVIGGEALIQENMTLTPGMPFEAADESLRQLQNPAALVLQDATPLVKVPIEGTFDTQFYSGIPLNQKATAVPETWKKIPGFMRALEGADMARRTKNGEWIISGEHAYVLEQNLPLLGRVRRMFPSEEKYQDRAVTSWLSFLGLGSRTVDPAVEESEMYRRADELREIRDRRREEGYEVGDPVDERRPR